MRKLFFLIWMVLFSTLTFGHPSWGIAITENGDIYFADVLHNGTGTVWKLDQKGNVTQLLTDFHAHYLQLDNDGNLWIAENRWIQGEVEGEGEHTLLKITPDGKKETIIFTDDWDNFFGSSFAIGPSDNVYFTMAKKVWSRPFDSDPELLIDYSFERLVSLYCDEDFNLWIADKGHKNGTLFKWDKEIGLTEYATDLIPVNPPDPIFEEERFHLPYDIKKDESGFMYLCENAGRSIQKIDQNGQTTMYYTSEQNWYPAGIAFYNNEAYIMEIGYLNGHMGPKIIKLDQTGNRTELFNYETYKKR